MLVYVTLGAVQPRLYHASIGSDGVITLTPAEPIDQTELAALNDPEILAAINRSRTPRTIRVVDRGSFAGYASTS